MEEKEVYKVSKGGFKSIIAIVSVIIILVVVVILLKGKDPSLNLSKQPRLKTKRPAPDFILPGLDGKTARLTDYKGKVVLLNVWATWCPSCVEEMPSMEELYNGLKGEDFEIMAVSIDESGAKAVVPLIQQFKLSFPVLVDPGGKIIKHLYRTTGIPESFVIDKEGNIQQIVIGPTDWATLEAIHFFRYLIQKPRQKE
jgi:peroxiredoxin